MAALPFASPSIRTGTLEAPPFSHFLNLVHKDSNIRTEVEDFQDVVDSVHIPSAYGDRH